MTTETPACGLGRDRGQGGGGRISPPASRSDRATWLAERRTGIGGSDAAAVLGLSPWKTPLQVYLEKRGETPEVQETAPMRWGTLQEPVIRAWYEIETGRHVEVPALLRHPEHHWMFCSLDGIADGKRLLEIKTSRSGRDWGEPGTDQVPQAYLLQTQHGMAVTALPIADVAVLVGGNDPRIYEVPADAELQAMLIEAEAEFWRRVVEGDPPPPISVADARALWGRQSNAASMVASGEVERTIVALRDLRETQKDLEDRADELTTAILAALGEADTLIDPAGRTLATWKLAKAAERFDGKRFAADHPDLHAQYKTAGEPTRRFLLKQ